MAKTALINKQQRKPKFKVRAYRGAGGAAVPTVFRKFGLCRACACASWPAGELPGVTKASW